MPTVSEQINIRTVSEANDSSHWANKAKLKRRSQQKKSMLNLMLLLKSSTENGIKLPCHIHLVRIAPRSLDDDNLLSAFKLIRDTIASSIRPGLAPGRADETSEITWTYAQEKGEPKQYAVRIVITF